MNNNMPAPCYVCGQPSVVDGMCPQCYNIAHPLIQLEKTLSMTICRSCNAVRLTNGWRPIVDTVAPSELLEYQIRIFLPSVVSRLDNSIHVDFQIEKRLDRTVDVVVTGTGTSHPDLPPHEEHVCTKIRVEYSTCESCTLMRGGYHDAIIQVRADSRRLTEAEYDTITDIVHRRTYSEYGHDVKAFVTSIDEHKYGIDFKIGSEHLARKIADEIEWTFLAERKENYKLVTQEHDGRRKYRITIMLRLPRFVVGDFIMVSGHLCRVNKIGPGTLNCQDLEQGHTFSVAPKSVKWQSVIYVASATESRLYTVIAHGYQQPYQLMDLETYQVFEVDDKQITCDVDVGSNVRGILLNDRFYFIAVDG